MLTDSHCHKVQSTDIRTIFNIRINDEVISLPHGPNMLFSVGIHPWDVQFLRNSWYDNLKMLLNFEQIIAVGECGFDKNATASFELQLDVFKKQIEISEQTKKPLVIHCVGHFNDLIRLKKQMNPKQAWIVHGFRGKPALARQITDAGMFVSFGEKFNPESVRATPIDKILVESDESNVPIQELYLTIATAKGCEIRELNAVNHIFNFKN
ncbi:hypothetical protein MASR2M117_20110 [Paludibacter sp.]